jgi:hypothetical protein
MHSLDVGSDCTDINAATFKRQFIAFGDPKYDISIFGVWWWLVRRWWTANAQT